MLKELIMKVMGFTRISFGKTELYFSKKIDGKTNLILHYLSQTDPTLSFFKSASNPQESFTILILQSSNVGASDVKSLDNVFEKKVEESCWRC